MTVEEIEEGEADASSEEFADLLNAIEQKPDAARRLDELYKSRCDYTEENATEATLFECREEVTVNLVALTAVKNMFYVGETIRVHTPFPANAGSLIKLQGRR